MPDENTAKCSLEFEIPNEAPGEDFIRALGLYFARFDDIEAGFRDAAVNYVLTGENRSILAELGKHEWKVKDALDLSARHTRSPNDLEPYKNFGLIVRFLWLKNRLMACRFCEILALQGPDMTARKIEPLPGQEIVPLWLHYFVAMDASYRNSSETNRLSLREVAHFADSANVSVSALLYYAYRVPLFPSDMTARKTLIDVAPFIHQHRDLLLKIATTFQEPQLVALFADLQQYGLMAGRYLQLAFDTVASAKAEAAQAAQFALGSASSDDLRHFLGTKLGSAVVAERKLAIELLSEYPLENAAELLQSHASSEVNPAVRLEIEAALQRIAARPRDQFAPLQAENGGNLLRAIDGTEILIPPIQMLEPISHLLPEQERLLRATFDHLNKSIESARNAAAAAGKQFGRYTEVSARDIEDTISFLSKGELRKNEHGMPTLGAAFHNLTLRYGMEREVPEYSTRLLQQFLATDFTLMQSVRLTFGSGHHNSHYTSSGLIRALGDEADLWAQPLARCIAAGGDFRAALKAAQEWNIDTRRHVEIALLDQYSYGAFPLQEPLPTSVFHAMVENLDLFDAALGLRSRFDKPKLSAERALTLVEAWPRTPQALFAALLHYGLSGEKRHRKRARRLLAPSHDVDAALVARLADTSREMRIAAAGWLGERRHVLAEDALRRTLRTETAEDGRAAMLTALARIGADISEEFSEKILKAEAAQGLEKNQIKSLAWFPFDDVPDVHWTNGNKLPRDVVKWWIVLADKLKEPAGNALFDIYLDYLKPSDAEALSLWVLQTFIARDTMITGEADARKRAEEYVDQLLRRNPNWTNNRQQTIDHYTRHYMPQQKGCSENRGILGLSVRAPGPEAANLVRRYLKDNGSKVNQSKALLTSLARNPHPSAIQAVLAAANRLKQKTTQAMARELVEGIAADRGWSADELADRTIPSGGFGENRELELDCGGGRMFKAVYRGAGRIELFNSDSKGVKALPSPKGEEDKEVVAAAKKSLSDAKKQVKQVEELQATRLYEAMCTERTWPAQIWMTYLKCHPIVGDLVQRLIWLVIDGEGKIAASFRLLDDGSLTDNTDNPIQINEADTLKLAHQELVLASEADTWVRHLRDFEISPLFAQFGKDNGGVKPRSGAMEISDREGWMVENFKIAGLADKLGYERGDVLDGGGFYEYLKRFPGLRICAVIKFTGSYVGATEKFSCALETLSFQRLGTDGKRSGGKLKIDSLPKVLVSETIGDLIAMASAGSGYDKDWRSRSQY